MTRTEAFLSSTMASTADYSHAQSTLQLAPDGSYIVSHSKKDSNSHSTNCVISTTDPASYAMIATLTDPIKNNLTTSITARGQSRPQVASGKLTVHTRMRIKRA